MDEKTEHIQVTLSRKKYNNSEYDDNTVVSNEISYEVAIVNYNLAHDATLYTKMVF